MCESCNNKQQTEIAGKGASVATTKAKHFLATFGVVFQPDTRHAMVYTRKSRPYQFKKFLIIWITKIGIVIKIN